MLKARLYYFELKKMKINDNIKSLKESVNKKNMFKRIYFINSLNVII